ncbi:uncharacterized protein GGS22DRAFT_170778 [Annulohypoxylon maeteangense]|uniref:uncharacterized protein n=1 Tax=Annulohypoxylon maeteangense TaxID=1927788 RepID=UPI0020083F47|nr:uncharacterized protein GGS22DRAFT_170778 [Annulohypoxylon maeteangense]KAI0882370.1 hypothetical protein GGS22DRAFT_170778 [Annulohypoxylon maeteangense]
MDLSTVTGVVEALVATYTAGLEYYTKWQKRKWQGNQYKAHTEAGLCGGNPCALSTSLNFSARKVREAFDEGVDILGDGFATGDDICRRALQGNLELLQERIYALYQEIRAEDSPLDLFEAVRVSERVRVSAIVALTGQYKRVAVGRLVPLVLPGSQQRSRLSATMEEETVKPSDVDGGVFGGAVQCAHINQSTGSMNKSSFMQSELPSPPPTPKHNPDDTRSTYTPTISTPRPKNSVFSIFCPEALKYQVNPQKKMPKRRNCGCGYDWDGLHTKGQMTMMVKEGFMITARFLGKSHCDGGFGCVLCTSSGRTETYSNVESLKDHINASHTKWQLLHDRDMIG